MKKEMPASKSHKSLLILCIPGLLSSTKLLSKTKSKLHSTNTVNNFIFPFRDSSHSLQNCQCHMYFLQMDK